MKIIKLFKESSSKMCKRNEHISKNRNYLWTEIDPVKRSHNRRLLMLLFMMLVLCHIMVPVSSWDCVCNPRECEVLEPSGCPGMGVIVWDPCRCCKICARTPGESCGGFSGTCEPDLKCIDGICSGKS